MIKEHAALFNRIAMAVDVAILAISLVLSYRILLYSGRLVGDFSSHSWVLLYAIPLWLFFLYENKLYVSIRKLNPIDIFAGLLNAHTAACLVLGFVVFFFYKDQFSRGLFTYFTVISFVLLFIEKVAVRASLGHFRRLGFNYRNLLIVGTREKAHRLLQLLEEHKDWGLKVLGFLQAAEDQPLQESYEGRKVLGYAKDLMDICKSLPVDEVIFCLPKDMVDASEERLKDLEELGITFRMVLDFYDLVYSKKEFGLFHDELPILTFSSKNLDPQQLLLKRLLDIVGAVVGLLLTGLFLPFIALAIKLDSPGPLFFSQERVGESGRRFMCWKFRSMFIDAERRKQELMDQNEMKGAIFKIKDDPRITKVGKFLRKTSLDELPQFWNVLKGEMSLVGTRPPTPAEVNEYENWHRRRITIKPGITGMWQVSGRNMIDDFDEIVRLDIMYIDNWNLLMDIKILLKTIKVVFMREGSS